MKRLVQTGNQRAAYRVDAASGGEAQIWVGLSGGPVLAELDDVSARGCGFRLESALAGELAVDQNIVLRILVGGKLMPQLFIRGCVKGIRDEGSKCRIGVQFDDTERLYTQLREPQWRYFNRRGAFRVPPADDRGRPLRARFHTPGEPEPKSFALHDLSSSGLSISLRPPNDASFPRHIPVSVEFTLPGAEVPTSLKVLFVHKQLIEGRPRIGFRIDATRTDECEEQCERILRYVMERQRQLLAAQ